jgi:hypothetical protein
MIERSASSRPVWSFGAYATGARGRCRIVAPVDGATSGTLHCSSGRIASVCGVRLEPVVQRHQLDALTPPVVLTQSM